MGVLVIFNGGFGIFDKTSVLIKDNGGFVTNAGLECTNLKDMLVRNFLTNVPICITNVLLVSPTFLPCW